MTIAQATGFALLLAAPAWGAGGDAGDRAEAAAARAEAAAARSEAAATRVEGAADRLERLVERLEREQRPRGARSGARPGAHP
jgi:hypothetical protein